jgi:formate dehydrogenase (coenzyme F420) beta subunit
MDKTLGVLKTNNSPNKALAAALGKLLDKGLVDAVICSGVSKGSGLPMPMLFTKAEAMEAALPLAPAAGTSAAVQAARMSRGVKDKRVAVVLKPCEVRGIIELAKLNQATLSSLVIISMQCPGRMENDRYLEELARNSDLPDKYLDDPGLQEQATSSCLSCEAFEPVGADIVVHLIGLPVMEKIVISAQTGAGREITQAMELEDAGSVPDQTQALSEKREKRAGAREELFQQTAAIVRDPDRYLEFFGKCLGCFNCRTACPVCYCRECVCSRESFDRDLTQVMGRADKSGQARMPAALGMFHMTRLTHMAHACVGCGQCSSFCPSSIPVADLFRTLGSQVQKSLDYSPGQDPQEPIPYLKFNTEAGS